MASLEQKTEINIEHLCRTCLSKDNELHSLFDIFVGPESLNYVVTAITGLKIHKEDGLPSTICCQCKELAEKAFNFKKKSQESHNSLKIIIKKEKLDVYTNERLTSQNNEQDNVKIEYIAPPDVLDDFPDGEVNNSMNNGSEDTSIDAVKNEVQDANYFECKNCYLIFRSQHKFDEHRRKKCVKDEYSNSSYCPLCETCYDGAENLSKHMWDLHSEIMGPKKRGRPKKLTTSSILNKLSVNGLHVTAISGKIYGCLLCDKRFKTKDELSDHMTVHKDKMVYCCSICKKMYLDKKYFEEHTCISNKLEYNPDASPDSKMCKDQSLFSETVLQTLLNSDSDMENSIKVCSACTCVFQSEEELTNHHDAEHPELSLRCGLCMKVFASLRTAARHRSICKQIERKHKCNTCGLRFSFEISLNKHILRYHEGQSVSVLFMDPKTRLDERKFQCDTCNKSFYRKDSLVKHTKIHMPNEKNFECDVCEKKFRRSDHLRSHKRVHDAYREETSPSNCLCLYCGRSFSNSSNLIVHIRRHTGEKPYKCDFCGKGFPRSSDLQCHRRSHTGEKPCVCRICGKGFSRSNKLSRHMRVHTGLRPYKCMYCEKAFSQSNDLTLHIRRHTGDRPYICEICGDRFIQGTALQNHRRAHGHFPTAPVELPAPVQTITYSVSDKFHNTQ